MVRYIIAFFLIIFTTLCVYAFSGGITGATRKNGNGCICHGTNPSSEVNVAINGPDTILVNDSAEFFVTLSGGPLVRGGTNIAVRRGVLIPGPGLRMLNDELTHVSPFAPQNNSVTFIYKYKAPPVAGIDTMYANGNSVNFDGFSVGDKWNFAPDKKIVVSATTKIINLNVTPDKFILEQNYPNPFNPVTTIKFNIPRYSSVKLFIINTEGRIIDKLLDTSLNTGSYEVKWNGNKFASGTYFYKLAAGNFSKTKSLILIK